MPLIDNIDRVRFASLFKTDLVLGTYSGSITIPIRTDPPNTAVIDTGLSLNPFFRGVFSTDGKDWNNDIGAAEFADNGDTNFGLRATATGGIVTLETFTDDLSTHTCEYKLAVLARPFQGIVAVPETDLPDINEYLNGTRNYRKIASEDEQPHTITSAATSSYSYPHSLGYVPSVECFIEVSGVMYDVSTTPTIATNCTAELRISDTEVTVFFVNGSGGAIDSTICMRVYYDEH